SARTALVQRLSLARCNQAASEKRHHRLRIFDRADVRFGSKADIASVPRHVRFTPESGHCSSDRKFFIAAKYNAFGFLSPRCVNSIIFSATNLVMASLLLAQAKRQFPLARKRAGPYSFFITDSSTDQGGEATARQMLCF